MGGKAGVTRQSIIVCIGLSFFAIYWAIEYAHTILHKSEKLLATLLMTLTPAGARSIEGGQLCSMDIGASPQAKAVTVAAAQRPDEPVGVTAYAKEIVA